MKSFAIINPDSGNSDPDQLRSLLREKLGPECEVFMLDTDEHVNLKKIVIDQVREGMKYIIAAGGDGTVSGVADGVAETNAILGIIPTGSGNGLAQDLDIPIHIEKSIELIGGRHGIRHLDTLEVKGYHVVMRLGIGFEADILETTKGSVKEAAGGLAYFWNALKKWSSIKRYDVTLTVDGETYQRRNIQHIALLNAQALGMPYLNLSWGPHIEPDDGRIDVCLIKRISLIEYLRLFLYASQDETHHDPSTRYLSARERITISTSTPLPVHVDGEVIDETPITASVMPGSVRVIVPPGTT